MYIVTATAFSKDWLRCESRPGAITQITKSFQSDKLSEAMAQYFEAAYNHDCAKFTTLDITNVENTEEK